MTMTLMPTTYYDYMRPLRLLSTGHPLLQERWPVLVARLAKDNLGNLFINEVFRYDVRQQWLFGAGRTEAQVIRYGVPKKFARPKESIVTNAWSAETSAHGWTQHDTNGIIVPAAAALDVVPLGKDGKPWSVDDPWKEFLAALKDHGYDVGLVHFTKPGKDPWDKPHLQLREWSDKLKKVIL